MTLSPPAVVKVVDMDGNHMEPWETVLVEADGEHASAIIERMSSRGANVSDMQSNGDKQVMKFEMATAGFLGMRTWIREASGGTAVVHSEYLELRPAGPPPPRTRNGVLVSNSAGVATAVDLSKAARLGTLFIPEGVDVYPGMIFGESG